MKNKSILMAVMVLSAVFCSPGFANNKTKIGISGNWSPLTGGTVERGMDNWSRSTTWYDRTKEANQARWNEVHLGYADYASEDAYKKARQIEDNLLNPPDTEIHIDFQNNGGIDTGSTTVTITGPGGKIVKEYPNTLKKSDLDKYVNDILGNIARIKYGCDSDSDCDDNDKCTEDKCIFGKYGKSYCDYPPVPDQDGDGCCAPGKNNNDDSDCPAVCCNNVLENKHDPKEICDKDCPPGQTCSKDCKQCVPKDKEPWPKDPNNVTDPNSIVGGSAPSVGGDPNGTNHIGYTDPITNQIYYTQIDSQGNKIISDLLVGGPGMQSAIAVNGSYVAIVWQETGWDFGMDIKLTVMDLHGNPVLWQWQVNNDIGMPYDAVNPDVAIDPANNICIVWQDYRAGSVIVQEIINPAGPVLVLDDVPIPAGGYNSNPAIASGGIDEFYICYESNIGGNADIWVYQTLTPIAQPICTTSQESLNPRLDVDEDGSVHIVWQEGYDSAWQIYYVKWVSGIITAQTPITDLAGCAQNPDIALDDVYVNVVWTEEIVWDIVYQKLDKNGVITGSSQQVSNTASYSGSAVVTTDPANNVYAFWSEDVDGRNQIWMKKKKHVDMVPGGLMLLTADPAIGQTAIIRADIGNFGNDEAEIFEVKFFVNGLEEDSTYITVESGGIKPMMYYPMITSYWTDFSIEVDPGSEVDEYFEDNNYIFGQINAYDITEFSEPFIGASAIVKHYEPIHVTIIEQIWPEALLAVEFLPTVPVGYAHVKMEYNKPGSFDELKLRLYQQIGGQWQLIPSSNVNVKDNYVWANDLPALGLFAVMECNSCIPDSDMDLAADDTDNCDLTYNPTQEDTDEDTIGDVCECSRANIDMLNSIDMRDFSILAQTWLNTGQGLQGDTNKDQTVDILDLHQVAQHWLGECD